MKKLINILLIISLVLVLFTGCFNKDNTVGERPDIDVVSNGQPGNTSTAEPSANKPSGGSSDNSTTTPAPVAIEPSEAMRIIVPRNSYNKFSEEDVLDWEEYIAGKYNFEIDIVTVAKDWNTNMDTYIKSLEKYVAEGGFIYVSDLETLKSLADSGMIEPVNHHIGKVDRYNVLPDELIRKLSDSSGDMWGFPLSDNIHTYAPDRYYSNEWLEAADMDVPVTIEEFYEFAMFVGNTDLDGNGEFDSYVANYADYMWLYDLGDIFKAFGCYFDGQNPVAYNPNKGIYENCIFNENFKEAITFIKLLDDEGVLFNRRPESAGSEELEPETYQIAATTRIDRENIFEKGLSVGNYLTGINQENICENRYSSSCLAIIKGTSQVSESITGLMNLLKSDPNSRMDFAYGIEGVHYEDNDEEFFSVSNKDEMGNRQTKRMDIHIWLSDMGFAEKYIVTDGVDYIKQNAQFYDMITTARDEKEEISDDVKYTIPFDVYDNRLDEIRDKIYGPTRDLFRAIISGGKGIDEAIEEYQFRLNGLKIPDTIEAMNADLN